MESIGKPSYFGGIKWESVRYHKRSLWRRIVDKFWILFGTGH